MHAIDLPATRISRRRFPWFVKLIVLALTAVVFQLGRGRGYRIWALRLVRWPHAKVVTVHPSVEAGQPGDMEDNILPETAIAAYLNLPNGKIDPATLTPRTVRLLRTLDGTPVPAAVELSPGGHKVSLLPAAPLQPSTNYTFCLTEGLHDLAGAAMEPWAISFTTKAGAGSVDPLIRFDSVRLQNTLGHAYTALRIGPDHQLYAATDDGLIYCFPIEQDGTLGNPAVITSLQSAWGPRIIIGLCFQPCSTADHMALWISHNEPVLENTHPFGGAISRLSGPSLRRVQDAVVNLPRSYRDHMTNQPAFGPDGALYIPQGSNSASGDADPTWGNRPEVILSGAILRLDVMRIFPDSQTSHLPGPIDAAELETQPDFHPFDHTRPLSIWAVGIRNAYSLIWHSNGQLYVPVNGSSSGGNAPAGDGAPALRQIPFSEDDYLFDIHPGKYYGHPNPAQGHFVLHGGNPTDPGAPQRISIYPPGTRPDRDWEPAVYNFGKHVSPNGVIEYRGSAFAHHLDHKLLVCRFNLGSDIVALDIAADGTVRGAQASIPGLRSLACPLDLAEDAASGNLYVSEYGGKRILLARPVIGERPTPLQ